VVSAWLKRRRQAAPRRQAPEAPAPHREEAREEKPLVPSSVPEIGGQKGPEPTRYGDWEKGGRCTDF
jgi:hypothetical protein